MASTRDTLDEIAATDPAVLFEQAATVFAESEDNPPPAWRIVEKRPEQWLEDVRADDGARDGRARRRMALQRGR